MMGKQQTLFFFSQMDNRIPTQEWGKMRTVRLNGQITEVKQPRLGNSMMGDHLGSMHFVFLWLAEILGQCGKFASSVGILKTSNVFVHKSLSSVAKPRTSKYRCE